MKFGKRGRLHGGQRDQAPTCWYRYQDGLIRNGHLVVTYFLTDANAGDGGFACIPGSHKSNFLSHLPGDVRDFERRPHYLVQPGARAGDALIFTEALIHGTLPWTADHERRALLYKYMPGHINWHPDSFDPQEYSSESSPLTEQQKRILAPPYVKGRPDSLVMSD